MNQVAKKKKTFTWLNKTVIGNDVSDGAFRRGRPTNKDSSEEKCIKDVFR